MKLFTLLMLLSLSLFADKLSIFKVEGMHCPLCTTAVKKAVKSIDGVIKASAKLNTKEVSVYHKENVTIEVIKEAIKTTSYEGVLISSKDID